MFTLAATLTQALQALAPITGVSIGDPADKATWRVDFLPEATEAQRDAAAAAVAAFDPENLPTPVPSSVTMRQARIALHRAGLLTAVQAAVDASTDPEVSIWWDWSNEVQRDNPFINAIGGGLGLTTEQIDTLFKTAAAL